jgi:hypothetical protein
MMITFGRAAGRCAASGAQPAVIRKSRLFMATVGFYHLAECLNANLPHMAANKNFPECRNSGAGGFA